MLNSLRVRPKSNQCSYRHHKGQNHKDKPEPDLHLRKGGVVCFPQGRHFKKENKRERNKNNKNAVTKKENTTQQEKDKYHSLFYKLEEKSCQCLSLTTNLTLISYVIFSRPLKLTMTWYWV